jgi:transcriptional regulator with XRE-family HTH domain
MITRQDVEFDLADRLGKSLRVAGVSIAEMAKHLELHRNNVGGYLNRRQKPSLDVIEKWAAYVGVPRAWICDGVWPDTVEVSVAYLESLRREVDALRCSRD